MNTQDICFIAVVTCFAVYIVCDVVLTQLYKKQIALLKERVKIWGDCAYVCGYHDGLNNKPKQPPVLQEETEK